MLILHALILAGAQAMAPIDYGRRLLSSIAGERTSRIHLRIQPDGSKESYRISPDASGISIIGSDQNGAMYGALEFAERLRIRGASAWKTKATGKPFLADRGLNLFLTLPWNVEKNNTDYEIAALTDPNRWWFQNDDYWTTLLDLMAHSRLNWLDIHGGWDISVTNAPNLYSYFVTSPSFPKVGVPDDVKASCLARLNKVIAMAHARGIRVSLMCYEANLRIPQNPNPPYDGTEANIYKYTKEVVEQMIRRAPGLDAIGFRIGESGRSESFFKCYGEAVKASGRDIPLITRSWITRKQRVLPLARASKDFTVEIKYNGEQWGAPYMVAGGRMANWYSYSFEDYLSDSNPVEKPNVEGQRPARLWPGNPAEGGGRWPDQPYKIVWQVRANGTHRIFPFYNPELVRSSIKEMKIGTASGYTIEGEDAYYPKNPLYYLADPKTKYCNWTHQRDEMYWMTWGRLGYDPNTPDAVFDAKVKSWFGDEGGGIAQDWRFASMVIPAIYSSYSQGPDHRNHAPELEHIGGIEAFQSVEPFDTFTYSPINEQVGLKALGVRDGRMTMPMVGSLLEMTSTLSNYTVDWSKIPDKSVGRIRELVTGMKMLGSLSDYFQNRMRAAIAFSELERATGKIVTDSFVNERMDGSIAAWKSLSDSPEAKYYKPFTEKLRMGSNTFHWRAQFPQVSNEGAAVTKLERDPTAVKWDKMPAAVTVDQILSWKGKNGMLECSIPAKGIKAAFLMHKPLPSAAVFHKSPMVKEGEKFIARIPRENWGECLAAEITLDDGDMARVPSVITNGGFQAPYLVVPARSGPTPQIYSSEEALAFLDPTKIDPSKYGAMVLAPRANDFFRNFDRSMRRKLLDPIRRGMTLFIFQQDYLSGRYSLDFFPQPLKVEACSEPNVFDPDGALGLSKIETKDILWQRFVKSPGWDVYGNGGIAHLKLGKGQVWAIDARFMQRMTYAPAAQAFGRLLRLCGGPKPAILIDTGTEGGVFTSSLYPDMMNALSIPFLTLGEVVAKAQGMNSFTSIAGPIMDDDVLDGKGQAMANKFLRDQVIALSKRPTPATISGFEKERVRRRQELMKSLGLDPMPPRTPLNARITGTIQRSGYHIEKLVFESRPKFFVTGHVYVPDGIHGKLPIIVHVNGHWAHKKDEDRIQLRAAFCALQGYIAIAIDSPGHSFEGNSLIERRPEGDHNDWTLVEGGTNATGYYVWDAIRALDYMATRTDTDMTKIGITGASGGGLATLYTFAADDRYKAAVPVVYMASMELAPDNGCLCNHVPGTSQVGDRSDVIAIQAPKPVFIMGAKNDGEFPPAATLLTHKKMQETWRLFGKAGDVLANIYDGPHDYNQLMREQMIGFFDKYIKGEGDGSPVPQPSIQIIDPEDHQLLALDPPAEGERTMRELSQEYLSSAPANVSIHDLIAINGGPIKKTETKYREIGTGTKRAVIFESEPGLQTPGILYLPEGKPNGVRIFVSDDGKQAEIAGNDPNALTKDGYACLYLDILGTGELSDIELRFPIYAGRSVAYTAGWQILRASQEMQRYSRHIELIGKGPLSSLSVVYAGLFGDGFAKVTGRNCLRQWADVFEPGVTPYAIQPRAHLCGSIENLRRLVKNGEWQFER